MCPPELRVSFSIRLLDSDVQCQEYDMEIKIEVVHAVPLEEAKKGHVCPGIRSDTIPRRQVVRVAVGLDKDKTFGGLVVRDWPKCCYAKVTMDELFRAFPLYLKNNAPSPSYWLGKSD